MSKLVHSVSLTRAANASKSKKSIILQVEARMRELDSSCGGAVADHQEVLIVSGQKLNNDRECEFCRFAS